MRILRSVALSVGLLVASAGAVRAAPPAAPEASAAQNAAFDRYVPGAAELEGRIIAPCCWTQTIDIHGSEVSSELRQEIRRRLLAGERSAAIEASLVQRYGPKILAVPPGSRLTAAGSVLVVLVLGAGIGAAVLLRRWQRRSKRAEPERVSAQTSKTDAELDKRVDAELAELDGN